jgi:hypothetical protein
LQGTALEGPRVEFAALQSSQHSVMSDLRARPAPTTQMVARGATVRDGAAEGLIGRVNNGNGIGEFD